MEYLSKIKSYFSIPYFLKVGNYLPYPVWLEITGCEGKCIIPNNSCEFYINSPLSKIIVKVFKKNNQGEMIQLIPDQTWGDVTTSNRSWYDYDEKNRKCIWSQNLLPWSIINKVPPEEKEELQIEIKKEQERQLKLEEKQRERELKLKEGHELKVQDILKQHRNDRIKRKQEIRKMRRIEQNKMKKDMERMRQNN